MNLALKIGLLILFVSSFFTTKAQLDNSLLYDIHELQPEDSNKLFLQIDALGLNKNNEYFNDIADGYTLFGYQLIPMITYQPLKNFSISAGAFFQDDFGREGYQQVTPLLRFTYRRDTSLQVIFGYLNGALAHRLIEPLYDFDRALVDPVENGLQIRYFKNTWYADFWIDWQQMIYEGDPFQEEVTGGLVINKEIRWDRTSLFIPIQLLMYHKGGQIDTSPAPLITFWNSAFGLKLQHHSEGFIKRTQGSVYYLSYQDLSHQKEQPFNDGEGYYANLSVTTDFHLQVMLSYWRGKEFLSIQGGQLFPSVSSVYKRPDIIEPVRELLILRFSHQIPIYKNISLTSRFEPYYDLQNKKFEFSHGLYINFTQKIPLLSKVKK